MRIPTILMWSWDARMATAWLSGPFAAPRTAAAIQRNLGPASRVMQRIGAVSSTKEKGKTFTARLPL
jgi:hypothetical protein